VFQVTGRSSLRWALAAALLLCAPQPLLAQGFPEIELTAEQAAEIARLKAATDDSAKFNDPASYKAAYEKVVAYARTIYPEPHPEIEILNGEIHFADFMLGNSANLRQAMRDQIRVYEAAGPNYRTQLIESYNNLAVISEIMGFPNEAIEPMEKAIAMWREEAPPQGSQVLGQGIGNLAQLERALGQYEAALAHNAEAIAMLEGIFAADPTSAEKADALAVVLSNRTLYLGDLDRRDEALAASREVTARIADIVGPDAPRTAIVLVNGAILLTREGKAAEAEPLARRAVAIREAAFGPESSVTAEAYLALTDVLSALGRPGEGLPMLEHAYTVLRREYGEAAAQTLEGKGKLGRFHFALGDHERGIAEMREVLATHLATKVAWHRDVTDNQEFVARMLARAGKWDELEPFLIEAEASQRGTPAEHWQSFTVLQVLRAMVEARKGESDGARDRLNRVLPRLYESWREELEQEGARGSRNAEMNFAIGYASLAAFEAGDPELAFEIAQRFKLGPSDRAVLRSQQRAKASDPAIAARIRERQGLIEGRATALAAFEKAALAGDSAAAQQANATVIDLTGKLDAMGQTDIALDVDAVSLAELRASLADDQAVFLTLESELGTYVMAASRGDVAHGWAGIETGRLISLVSAARDRLDLGLIANVGFDTTETDALYAALFTPEVERVLAGKMRVAAIAKGELAKLPLSILTRTGADGSREWAIERFAFSYPVSLAGIGDNAARGSRARFASFVGVGAPALPASASATQLAFRSAENADTIAQLGRLGLAQGELEEMARALNARSSQILAGEGATEAAMRALDLKGVDIVTFATHGLMAGELDGLGEAALVLSPPLPGEAAGPENDGLLTTSEIAAMDIPARWVVLSACNSASGDSEGGEALGGLAHAFLYAGADTLLVSHWRVRDDAAARLTVGAARGAAQGLDPAEALRRAQLALMADGSVPGAAHPALWAPFVLVGN
jgi:CHAT domain-containing protein/tetratricopeptide (TPR) repeat protein